MGKQETNSISKEWMLRDFLDFMTMLIYFPLYPTVKILPDAAV